LIHLYGRHTSFNVQKVLWLLDELEVAYEHTDLGGAFGGLDTDAFGKLNPHRKVPVLIDDDTVIWESHAILRYLASTYGSAILWPRNPGEQAHVDQWMEWATNSLMPAFGRLFWGYYRTPEAERNQKAIQADMRLLNGLYGRLDAQLEGHRYLLGDELTLADIPAGTSLYRYFEMGLDVDRPVNLMRWYETLATRDAYRARVMEPFSELYGRLAF
jgi:glutathione S-transferase